MSKIALLTDTHFGGRQDSLIFDAYFEKFYRNVFFPTLQEQSITEMVHLGDIFCRRKFINFNILSRCREYYFSELHRLGIKVHQIVGNHDTFYKNTNSVNSPNLLLGEYPNVTVYSEATEIELDGTKIAIVPWICSGNAKRSFQFIENTTAQVCMGHLELAGFQMHRGSFSEHGHPMEAFSKFDMVFSGHFHHKSNFKNIWYLGAPYEITWADYDDPRGFHLFEPSKRALEYIQNPYFIHNKVTYSDRNKELEELLQLEDLSDSYVKVYVKDKLNPYWFDLFIDKIEKQGVHDIQIIDEGTVFDSEEEFLDDVEDTPTLLRKCCEQLDTNVDTKLLTKFMLQLHNEATEIE